MPASGVTGLGRDLRVRDWVGKGIVEAVYRFYAEG